MFVCLFVWWVGGWVGVWVDGSVGRSVGWLCECLVGFVRLLFVCVSVCVWGFCDSLWLSSENPIPLN